MGESTNMNYIKLPHASGEIQNKVHNYDMANPTEKAQQIQRK